MSICLIEPLLKKIKKIFQLKCDIHLSILPSTPFLLLLVALFNGIFLNTYVIIECYINSMELHINIYYRQFAFISLCKKKDISFLQLKTIPPLFTSQKKKNMKEESKQIIIYHHESNHLLAKKNSSTKSDLKL